VIVWRVLPVDPAAADDAAGGPLWFPREYQGAARHDNPAAYGCLYVAEAPVSAAAEGLRPSNVATRVRDRTQSDALALFESHRRATGLRWWSTIEASWINVTVFDRARRRLRLRSVELLSPDHEVVRAATAELGLA
jgi:hypothetical protein